MSYARVKSEAMIVIHLLISESKYRKGEHVCSAQHSQSELILQLTEKSEILITETSAGQVFKQHDRTESQYAHTIPPFRNW